MLTATSINSPGTALRLRVTLMVLLVLALNFAAWIAARLVARAHPVLIGASLLAYTLGLRHAFDADHIAAIDNVTRKLMQHGRRPVAAGFMFSLGHSSVVLVGALAITASALSVRSRLAGMESFGAVAGVLISAGFLLVIAAINAVVFVSLARVFARARRGTPPSEDELNPLLAGRGLIARWARPLFGLIRRSWHMYPLGALFGLGFDTATEMGLLGLAAAEAAKGLSLAEILVLPLLFAAGMTLLDTLDNLLMLGAYGWAFDQPLRKLHYNLVVTLLSVLVALLVGGVEVLDLLASRLHLDGAFWTAIAALNANFAALGLLIVALFGLCWLASLALTNTARVIPD